MESSKSSSSPVDTYRSLTPSSGPATDPEGNEPETFVKGKKNLIPPLLSVEGRPPGEGGSPAFDLLTPHPFDNLPILDKFPHLTDEDLQAFRVQTQETFAEFVIGHASTRFGNVADLEGKPIVTQSSIGTVAAGVAAAGIVSSAQFLLPKALGRLISIVYPDLGREAEVIGVALMHALFPKVEGIIGHQYGHPNAPDLAFEHYLDAQTALYAARLGGRADLAAEYEQLREDVVQSVVDRLEKDDTLPFRFENRKMIGVAVRACLSNLHLLGFALAYGTQAYLMTMLGQKMLPGTTSDRIIFYAYDIASFAVAGVIGGSLSTLMRISMNRFLQHGQPVRMSKPSEKLPAEYKKLNDQLESAQRLQQLIADGTMKLSRKNARDLLDKVDVALKQVEHMRSEWNKNHAHLHSAKVQAGAAAAAQGWPDAMSSGAKWLSNYLALLGAQVAMAAVTQALEHPPVVSNNGASNFTSNFTSDGMPGNSPNDILAMAPAIPAIVMGSLTFGRFVLAPLVQHALVPVTGAVLWAMGGSSPAPPAAALGGTSGDGSEPPTEGFLGLLAQFEGTLQSIQKDLKARLGDANKDESSGDLKIGEDEEDIRMEERKDARREDARRNLELAWGAPGERRENRAPRAIPQPVFRTITKEQERARTQTSPLSQSPDRRSTNFDLEELVSELESVLEPVVSNTGQNPAEVLNVDDELERIEVIERFSNQTGGDPPPHT